MNNFGYLQMRLDSVIIPRKMNFSFLLLFLCSAVFASYNVDHEADFCIQMINFQQDNGIAIMPAERNLMLEGSMKHHNRRLIHFMITTLYQNASNFRPETIQNLLKSPPRTLKEDKSVVFPINLDFGNEEAFETALFTARTFREYGHRVRVFISGHDWIDLKQSSDLLEEFIDAGQIDVNAEMKRAAEVWHFDLVFFFLWHGAQIDFFEGTSEPPSQILLNAIRRGKLETVKALVDYGAPINVHYGNNVYFIDIVFRMNRFDIAKILISHKAKTDSIWDLIKNSHQKELYLDAIRAGYDLDTETAKNILSDLANAQEFELAKTFLEQSYDLIPLTARTLLLSETIESVKSVRGFEFSKQGAFDELIKAIEVLIEKCFENSEILH